MSASPAAVHVARILAEILDASGSEVIDARRSGDELGHDMTKVDELIEILDIEAKSSRPINLPRLTAGAILYAIRGERLRISMALRAMAREEAIKAQKAGALADAYQKQGNGEEFIKALTAQDICSQAASLLIDAATAVEKEPGT